MQGRELPLGDGRTRIEMEVDPAEYEQIKDMLAKLQGVSAGGSKCCRCSNGQGHNVSEWYLIAFFECLAKCGSGFSLSDGPCS